MKTRKPKPFIHHLPVEPGGGRALCDKRANAPAYPERLLEYWELCKKCARIAEKQELGKWRKSRGRYPIKRGES